MSAALYPSAAIYAGDTWPGIPSISITVNGAPPTSPVVSAAIIFYRAEDGPSSPALTLSSDGETAQITISDDAAREIDVPPQTLALATGEWTFRFSTTDDDGVIRTWLTGILTIL